MKALNENIINKDRNKLENVLPLKTPYTLAIDPCNLCNFKCTFCAMQTVERKQSYVKQIMEFDLYTKIIDDLAKFPDKLKVLRLNGQGEPLLNNEFCGMVRYAKDKRIANWIETITNGSRLKPSFNQEIVDSGIDRIRISIEALDEIGYANMAKVKINYNQFMENIKDLYERSRDKCEIYIKIVEAAIPTEEEKRQFFDMFGDICDRIFIDKVIPLWSDFEDINLKFAIDDSVGVHGQKVKEVLVCPFPFYSLIINPDGEVTACCADWQRKLVLGDLKKESMLEIWNGLVLKKFQIDLLEKNKNKYEMCKKCLLPTYDCNDSIDEYTKIILNKMR